MEFTKYDLFAYQILDYLVKKHHYQIIRVQQHKDDIWLMNAQQEHYPVIRISSRVHEDDGSEHDYIRNVHRIILNLMQREGPIITLTTNPDIAPITDVNMKQILITPSRISDEQILTIFQELQDVVHESEQMDNDIATLTKEIEEAEHARQQSIFEKVEAKAIPKVTYVIVGVSILLSLCAMVLSYGANDALVPYVALGAYYKLNIDAAFEYWRFLSAGFLSPNLISLVISMFMLYYVGKACEPIFSRIQYCTILLSAIIVGNLFAWVGEGNMVSMGISAGIYGILGAYITHLSITQVIKHPLVRFTVIKVVSLSFILWLLPGISMLSFVGGIWSGVVCCILFTKADKLRLLKRNTWIASIVLLLVLLGYGSTQEKIYTFDKEFDRNIVSYYKGTPLNGYAHYLEKCYNKQYRLEY